MIVYQVNCYVKKEAAERWENYFVEEHLDDVLNTKCFTGYSFRKGEETKEEILFSSEYYCESEEHLKKYNEKYAAALKVDAKSKFDGMFRAERRIYEIMSEQLSA